jgi:hypothetical protein
MDKNDIIDYVMHTPHNTNKAVLSSMLNQLTDGGGGGSSDFSTATVTIVNGDNAYVNGAFIGEDDYNQVEGEMSMFYSPQASGANTLVLYKGQALLHVDAVVASVAGDIERLGGEDSFNYLVTGDCTITFS